MRIISNGMEDYFEKRTKRDMDLPDAYIQPASVQPKQRLCRIKKDVGKIEQKNMFCFGWRKSKIKGCNTQ